MKKYKYVVSGSGNSTYTSDYYTNNLRDAKRHAASMVIDEMYGQGTAYVEELIGNGKINWYYVSKGITTKGLLRVADFYRLNPGYESPEHMREVLLVCGEYNDKVNDLYDMYYCRDVGGKRIGYTTEGETEYNQRLTTIKAVRDAKLDAISKKYRG